MGRHLISFDDDVNKHLDSVLQNIKALGIKNASKTDALRLIINMNKQSEIQIRRKKRSKPNIKAGLEFF